MLDSFQDFLEEHPTPGRRHELAAPKTAKGYVQDMSIFLRWWKQTHGEDLTLKSLRDDPYRLNRKVLQDFLSWLETTQGHSAATIRRYGASLRTFTYYLQTKGLLKVDPTFGLRLPKPKKEDPRGLNDTQRARFEAVFVSSWITKITAKAAQDDPNHNPAQLRLVRDKAIAFLMLYAGPRVEEVVNLDVADIHLNPKSGVMHIRKGKGFKERDVRLSKPARETLRAWLTERTKLEVPHPALFIEVRRGTYERLTTRSIQSMIAEAGRRAELDHPKNKKEEPILVTPHVLRHTCAFMLRQAGVQPEVRAEMLGHSLQTALRYGAPKWEELERAADLLDDFATIPT